MVIKFSDLIRIYKEVEFLYPRMDGITFFKSEIEKLIHSVNQEDLKSGIEYNNSYDGIFLYESVLYLIKSFSFFLSYKWAMNGRHRIPGFQDLYYSLLFIYHSFLRLNGHALTHVNKNL